VPLLLSTRQLTVGHRRRPLLPPLDFEVQADAFWAVIGPNGAGKSTLIRTLLGLLPPVSGEVVRDSLRSPAYVPQRAEIDGAAPARVIDFVRTGLERGWSFLSPWWLHRQRALVEAALRDTRTLELARRPWMQLSEGQKQRVLMAQALASSPDLLVLDEPTSAMDLHAERSIFYLLTELQRQRGIGVLVVSHNLGLLARHATHLLFVDQDQQVACAGPLAEVAARPEFVLRYGPGFGRPHAA
jgi:zinc transport system ATP-binding protein